MNSSIERQAWLDALIENGEFGKVDEALGWLISERMAEESDDMVWARPYVDEARAAAASGGALSLEEYRARNALRLAVVK